MATLFYNNGKKLLINGGIDLDTDTIKVSLHSSSYTPDIDAHDFFDDLTNEVSTSGSYTAGIAGGITLANKAVTADNTNNVGKFDADDAVVTTFTGTARWAVLRKDTGVAGTSALIVAIDLTSVSTTAGTLTITWSSSGIINLA